MKHPVIIDTRAAIEILWESLALNELKEVQLDLWTKQVTHFVASMSPVKTKKGLSLPSYQESSRPQTYPAACILTF